VLLYPIAVYAYSLNFDSYVHSFVVVHPVNTDSNFINIVPFVFFVYERDKNNEMMVSKRVQLKWGQKKNKNQERTANKKNVDVPSPVIVENLSKFK
jgi:hypothetical protein